MKVKKFFYAILLNMLIVGSYANNEASFNGGDADNFIRRVYDSKLLLKSL